MSCENCRAAFAHANDDERARKFDEAAPRPCGCEKYRVSPHSPGPVTDDEVLCLLVSDPQMIVDGWLHPSKLANFDTSGQSVLREAAADNEFENTMAELVSRSKERGKHRWCLGVLRFPVHAVRYCASDRFLCVYDTGMEHKPFHADLMCGPLVPDGATGGQLKRARMELAREVITALGREIVGPSDFRSGLLMRFSKAS